MRLLGAFVVWGNVARRLAYGTAALVLCSSYAVVLLPNTALAAGEIVIDDCAELQMIGQDVGHPLSGDYLLSGDIDCSDTATWNGGDGFAPIGTFVDRFTGTFNGQTHAITDLFINRPSETNIGLFSIIDEGATVTNVSLTNVDITGEDLVGALAGGLVGHVENIHASGDVSGIDDVGGLVGQHVPTDNLDNSSPLVFTWNGHQYTYVADVGDQLPKETNGLDLAQIDNTDLVPKDGKYSVKIAQEYNEIVYYDELSLMTFDHAPGYTVVEPLDRTAGIDQLRTVSQNPTNQLQACTDMYGHDCVNDLKSYDGSWAYEDPSYDNCWVMDFGDLSAAKDTNVQLLMRGARDYSKTPVSKMRSVNVKDIDGNWVEVYNKNGVGSDGTPRLRSLDLTGKFLSNDYHIKVCLDTWQMNYFAIDTTPTVPFTTHTYHADAADLGYHGFTAIDRTHYPLHDYNQTTDQPKAMLQTQYGNFTKYGNVAPLLESTNDQFVVMRYGDQLDVQFPYDAPAAGTERSFMLYNDAFYKHANLGTIGRTTSPMPYHGMGAFDANTQYPLTTDNQAYLATWNTRHYDGNTQTGGSTIVDSASAVSVSGRCAVGGMVGKNYKPIIGSHATGDVEGLCAVGGLVGEGGNTGVSSGDISGSSASGSVSGEWSIGGLVGYASWNAIIVEDSYADGDSVSATDSNIGGLVGYADGVDIQNSYSKVGLVSGNSNVGGLVGYVSNSSVAESYATSDAEGVQYIGGLAGYIGGGDIARSYATGMAHATSYNVGGFGGEMSGGSVVDSYATGDALSDDSFVGGFIGTIYGGDVERNYASGDVFIDSAGDERAGGFVGESYEDSGDITLRDNFSVGHVSGPNGLGGFVANLDATGMVFENNHFNKAASGDLDCMATGGTTGCIADNTDGTIPNVFKQANDMPLDTWNFAETWSFALAFNDSYPCLQWQDGCQDSDGDGLPDVVEADGPNGGDANNDGTADSLQANVAGYHNSITDAYSVLAVPADCQIQSVSSAAEVSQAAQDAGFDYPAGLMHFTLDCGTPGYAASVSQYHYGVSASGLVVRKYNSVSNVYQAITGASVQQLTIGGRSVIKAMYTVTDGGMFDEDATANGTIVDPSGPATGTVGAPNTGIGGREL
jgi:hypothetical protein